MATISDIVLLDGILGLIKERREALERVFKLEKLNIELASELEQEKREKKSILGTLGSDQEALHLIKARLGINKNASTKEIVDELSDTITRKDKHICELEQRLEYAKKEGDTKEKLNNEFNKESNYVITEIRKALGLKEGAILQAFLNKIEELREQIKGDRNKIARLRKIEKALGFDYRKSTEEILAYIGIVKCYSDKHHNELRRSYSELYHALTAMNVYDSKTIMFIIEQLKKSQEQAKVTMSDGVIAISEERYRQMKEYSDAHDDDHISKDLAYNAYTILAPYVGCMCRETSGPINWGLGSKLEDLSPIKALSVVGALVAAEIDRLIRKKEKGIL